MDDGTQKSIMFVSRAIAALSMTFAMTTVAFADNSRGCVAYLQGDYAGAMRAFLPDAQKGDAAAQLAVGWLYDNALGVPHNDAEAAKWYLLAAQQGDARAQQYLGTMYAEGDGVPQDLAAAEHWFRLAALQGSPGGQYGLGVMYRDGVVVQKDLVEAYKWFSQASKSGGSSLDTARALAAKTAVAAIMSREQLARGDAELSSLQPAHTVNSASLCP